MKEKRKKESRIKYYAYSFETKMFIGPEGEQLEKEYTEYVRKFQLLNKDPASKRTWYELHDNLNHARAMTIYSGTPPLTQSEIEKAENEEDSE